MTNVNTARKAIVSAKDIALAVVTGGASKVRDLHNGSGFTAKTLDGAIALFDGTEHGNTLAALRSELFSTVNSGVRGRKPATVGATREYTVQEVGETGAFVRLPVGLLGLVKGDKVSVTFDDGVISVVRA